MGFPEAEGTSWLKVSVIIHGSVVNNVLADANQFLECDIDTDCLRELFVTHIAPIIGTGEPEIDRIEIEDKPMGRVINYVVRRFGQVKVVIHRADTDPRHIITEAEVPKDVTEM